MGETGEMSELSMREKRPGTERRIEEIEVLRAIAVMMVLVEHIPINLFYWHSGLQDAVPSWWSGGTGVDLFFTISGFVIVRSLLPRLQAAQGANFLAETLTFLLRRFWRLQPSAWLWLIIPTILSATFNETQTFHDVRSNVASAVTAILAVNNLRFGALFGVGDTGITFPYWSLSLEEQFYLLLPIAIYFLRKRLVFLMAGLLVYQFCMPAGAIYNSTRPGAIAVGVLLAMWSLHPSYRMARPAFLAQSAPLRFCFVTALVLLLGALGSDLPSPLFAVAYGMVAVLAGVLVYSASFSAGYIMRDGLVRRCFVWVGARSYAIYLVHMPAFALTREIYYHFSAPVWVASTWLMLQYLGIAFAIIAAVAELNYRFVEIPARRYGRTLRIAAPHFADA